MSSEVVFFVGSIQADGVLHMIISKQNLYSNYKLYKHSSVWCKTKQITQMSIYNHTRPQQDSYPLSEQELEDLLQVSPLLRFQSLLHHCLPDLVLRGGMCGDVTLPSDVIVRTHEPDTFARRTAGNICEPCIDDVYQLGDCTFPAKVFPRPAFELPKDLLSGAIQKHTKVERC